MVPIGAKMNSMLNTGCVDVWLDEIFLGTLHPFHFMLDKGAAHKLLEVYTYEWN